MKKHHLFYLLFALFGLQACGPSACQCNKHYQGNAFMEQGRNGRLFSEDVKKCINKYGKDIPDSYRGTNRFADEMRSATARACK